MDGIFFLPLKTNTYSDIKYHKQVFRKTTLVIKTIKIVRVMVELSHRPKLMVSCWKQFIFDYILRGIFL